LGGISGTIFGFLKMHLHVRLAGTDPHIAHQDIIEFLNAVGGDEHERIGTTGGKGTEVEAPSAEFIGAGAGFLAAEMDFDNCAGPGGPPEREARISLQNGMVGKK
jgi:hypothetical protein